MKRISLVLSVLLLAGAGCPLFQPMGGTEQGPVEDNGGEAMSEERTATGQITSINLDMIAFDGPAVVTIQTDAEAFTEIHVPSFGLLLCEAKANIADVYELNAGDRVEVRGSMNAGGSIVPCDSPDHYLRVISQ